MSVFLVVLCACANDEQAMRLATSMVERRLAACANILPPMRSVYRWKGEVQHASEHLLLLKTTKESFEDLRNALIEGHDYETPEIVALPVAAGSEPYLAWIRESVLR